MPVILIPSKPLANLDQTYYHECNLGIIEEETKEVSSANNHQSKHHCLPFIRSEHTEHVKQDEEEDVPFF